LKNPLLDSRIDEICNRDLLRDDMLPAPDENSITSNDKQAMDGL